MEPLKINKTKVLKTDGSVMQVESIEECSFGAFCNSFNLHLAIISLENEFWSSFGCLRQVLLYITLKLNIFD